MLLTLFPNYWDYWELRDNVTFDGENKLIIINNGVTSLDFKKDIYSPWKEWISTLDNMKYQLAISVVGGDPITGEISLGTTFFLENGWKIRPYEGDHILSLTGNVFSRDASSLFVKTLGNFNVYISTNRSNLIDTVNVSGSTVDLSGIEKKLGDIEALTIASI
jgi:hypothetical protein